jgi:hypothetical protein
MDQRVDHDIVTQGAPAPGTVRRAGLSGRVLMLTAVFVTLAQFVIFAPSIANFRDNWLRNRLSAAFTAALVLEGAERDLAPTGLPQQLLDSVGARVIVLKMKGTRRMLAAGQLPEGVAETYDMRDISVWASMRAAFRALVAPYGRIITVRGAAPMGGDFIEVTMDEAPLKRAMRDFSFSIVLRSLVVSALVGALAVLSLNWLVLRPVRRLTSSVVGFAAAPQDAARIIAPSGRADEIGDSIWRRSGSPSPRSIMTCATCWLRRNCCRTGSRPRTTRWRSGSRRSWSTRSIAPSATPAPFSPMARRRTRRRGRAG